MPTAIVGALVDGEEIYIGDGVNKAKVKSAIENGAKALTNNYPLEHIEQHRDVLLLREELVVRAKVSRSSRRSFTKDNPKEDENQKSKGGDD